MDKQRLWGFLAHTSIIVGLMFVIFFVIDRFNPAMEFLSSNISKWLILLFAVCSILNGLFSAVFLFQKQKRYEEKRENLSARVAANQNGAARQRLADPQRQPQGYMPMQRAQTAYGQANPSPVRQPRPAADPQYRRSATPANRPYSEFERRDPRER